MYEAPPALRWFPWSCTQRSALRLRSPHDCRFHPRDHPVAWRRRCATFAPATALVDVAVTLAVAALTAVGFFADREPRPAPRARSARRRRRRRSARRPPELAARAQNRDRVRQRGLPIMAVHPTTRAAPSAGCPKAVALLTPSRNLQFAAATIALSDRARRPNARVGFERLCVLRCPSATLCFWATHFTIAAHRRRARPHHRPTTWRHARWWPRLPGSTAWCSRSASSTAAWRRPNAGPSGVRPRRESVRLAKARIKAAPRGVRVEVCISAARNETDAGPCRKILNVARWRPCWPRGGASRARRASRHSTTARCCVC